MKRKFKRLFIIALILAVFLVGFWLFGIFRSQKSLLQIESNVESVVYVNGVELGKTPFEKDLESKEVRVKLLPSNGAPAYEVKVGLTPGVKTFIKRNFNANDSSGVVVSFEKELGSKGSISVVTNPDGAGVKINGISRGVSPLKISNLDPGNYNLLVFAPGYADEPFDVSVYDGYKLTAIVSLEKNGLSSIVLPTPAPKEETSSGIKKVQILSTPTGFLRVRLDASPDSDEVYQVEPGEVYTVSEEKENWIKIEYEEGKFGWVSSEYVKIETLN